jgi:hypothetical protein
VRRLLLILLITLPAFGTKLLLHDAVSVLGRTATAGGGIGCVNGTNTYTWRTLTTAQGSSVVSKTFAPTSSAPPCTQQTATGSGEYLRFISAPLSAGVTISGNIDYQAGCLESATAMNAGFRMVVYRWSRAKGGIDATIHTSASSAECTTNANKAIAAAAPTSTVMAVGDRIVVEVQVTNVGGGWGGNGTRTFQVSYDAGAGVTGDAFANFADTLSFAADTNNARRVIQ